MKILYSLFALSFLFMSCSTSRTIMVQQGNQENAIDVAPSNVQFLDNFTHVPADTKAAFLTKNKAESANYAMLFLTLGYKGEVVKVFTPTTTIYDGTTYTLKSNGIAGYMRVPNATDILITDDYTQATALLEAKYLKEYKFVYIKKDNNNKKEPYTITYSNNLRPL